MHTLYMIPMPKSKNGCTCCITEKTAEDANNPNSLTTEKCILIDQQIYFMTTIKLFLHEEIVIFKVVLLSISSVAKIYRVG